MIVITIKILRSNSQSYVDDCGIMRVCGTSRDDSQKQVMLEVEVFLTPLNSSLYNSFLILKDRVAKNTIRSTTGF